MYPVLKKTFPVLFLLLSHTQYAMALPDDNKEKVYIIADATTYNYKTGVNVFEGHVKVDQGTTHILADRLTTKTNNLHKIQEVTAYGVHKLAHYWTVPKVGEPEIHAHANIIKFYPIDSNVTLEQHVVVTQAENSFRGQLILYNMNDQTITVPASKDGRAVLIYNPDK
jgi:lipopolysaccharide export system protein LptA